MSSSVGMFSRDFVLLFLVAVLHGAPVLSGELEPAEVVEVAFEDSYLPPSLYEIVTRDIAPATLRYRLPDNYRTDRVYPLLVYVPGFHGGPNGNIGNAQKIAGPSDWVVASLPLFKGYLDRDEIGGGILIGFQDFATISRAYGIMLGRLFELVPNIEPERSTMVGFSNGALTIAVLVSGHDEFVLSHFNNFCLVDNGMFHLTDLHKKRARDSRYLILSGDNQQDLGRELKIRGGRLLQDAWRLLGVDIAFQVMENTGHEFGDRQMATVGRWLRREPFAEGDVVDSVR